MRPGQKTLVGTVVSDKMDKTVVVTVATFKEHRLYGKRMRRTMRYKAHDPNNVCRLGDTVRLVETRPISKEKRWRVVEILQHREVAEVKPAVIGREIEEEVMRAREESATEIPAAAPTAVEGAATEPGDVTSEREDDEGPEAEA
jgi:small subunit ribosomal protein S17